MSRAASPAGETQETLEVSCPTSMSLSCKHLPSTPGHVPEAVDAALARAQARRARLQQGMPRPELAGTPKKPQVAVAATPPPKTLRIKGKRTPGQKATPGPDNTPVLTPGQKHLKPDDEEDCDMQKRQLFNDETSDLP